MKTNIYTKEFTYLLGLIWADGHVSFANNNAKTPVIKHSCKESDHSDFLPIFKLDNEKWKFFISKNVGSYSKKAQNICVNWQSNRILGEFLIENDYRNKKNSPDKIINELPKDFVKFWYRGYFDGDGSISIKIRGHKSIAFTSSEHQKWEFITNLLDILNIKYKHRILKSRGGTSSQIRFSKQNDIIKFCEYIYSDYDEMGLNRKYEKYVLLKENIIYKKRDSDAPFVP